MLYHQYPFTWSHAPKRVLAVYTVLRQRVQWIPHGVGNPP